MVADGVVFPNGFSYMKDLIAIGDFLKETPHSFRWDFCFKKALNATKLPTLVG